MDKGLHTVSKCKKEVRKKEAKVIRFFPKWWGMKMKDFISEMGKKLNQEPDTVKKYLRNGFSRSISCDEICSAIQGVYEGFISDENNENEIKEQAKKVQESFGKVLLDSIKDFEKALNIIESNKAFLSTDFLKFLTIILFLRGGWPQKGKTLTEEEIDWLRKSFLKFPPKDIKLHN